MNRFINIESCVYQPPGLHGHAKAAAAIIFQQPMFPVTFDVVCMPIIEGEYEISPW
jgi:hypothetical protein